MKIALFGGSFNPVHNEHINIVTSALERFDKVIIIPSYLTPDKEGRMTASAADRLNMCRLAFGGVPNVEVSDYEIERGGVSYSYITCREFKKRYPDDELFFIVGADMFESFHTWKNPEKILECVTLAVCGREKPLGRERPFPCVEIPYTGKKVSSTRIRALAALGEDIGGYVPEKAADYIVRNALYKKDLFLSAKKYISAKRWKHTVGVAVAAAENCARFGVPEEKAITAAALHDCAKELPADMLEGFERPDGVPDAVVHQYAGAYMAEKHFKVSDADILNAIRYHTSGRENMSALEKLILISDVVEEGRDYDGVEEIRKALSENPEKGLLSSFEQQLKHLKETGKTIYPVTEKALNYLKENKNDK